LAAPNGIVADMTLGDILFDSPTPASVVLFGAAIGVLARLVALGIVLLDRVMPGPLDPGLQIL